MAKEVGKTGVAVLAVLLLLAGTLTTGLSQAPLIGSFAALLVGVVLGLLAFGVAKANMSMRTVDGFGAMLVGGAGLNLGLLEVGKLVNFSAPNWVLPLAATGIVLMYFTVVKKYAKF